MTRSLLTPLHVRSGYSLLRGTALPERLIERAGELGYARLALTDVNGLYAAPIFWPAAREAGLEPILGAELHDQAGAAVALVEDETGYQNLCRLITRAHRPEGFSLSADLAELSGGLHVIVADDALAASLQAAGVEAERLWVGIDPATQSQSQLRRLAGAGGRGGLRLVATGKALMAEEADREAARLLTAIRLGSTYDALPDDRLPNPQAHLRDPQRLRTQLVAFPDAVRNNRLLAERCAAYRFLPREVVFPRFPTPDGAPAGRWLRRLGRDGLRWRYGGRPPPGAHRRLAKELRLVERMGFSEYFLVVWDIVQYARRRGVPVAGRGSGASSLLAYLLGITNVCPLAFDIPFERFLHERREDFPDLDVDFCWRIRDDVIDYAMKRWRAGHVAMVSTHNTFQPASAMRETAKAWGLSDQQISRLAAEGFEHEQAESIARLSRRILNLPHNLSVHPGGLVITPGPIDRHVPIQPAPKGVMITQYDKDGVAAAGLVKLDLLGNRNLSTVRHACDLLADAGRRIDVEALPPADPATLATLRSAETVGCNQLESPAMRHLLKMLAPAHTRDVMKALALIRPGAASIGMKEVFVRRHRGLEASPPGHPAVDAILADTCGVMMYEDDVMLVATAMAGGSIAEGDRFRRAVQKCRDDDQRLALSREFLTRCRANGVEEGFAKSLWVQMAKFNAYSFCRAHAASYAVLAYAGAYLKTHFPLEFWTAALNNNQSMYHPRVYVEQAKRSGVGFLLPDVNRSGEEFRIEGGAIRVGLNFIAGLGPAGVAAILEARRRGAFAGLTDFLSRAGLGREEARSLVLCGAFDFTRRPRPGLMIELDLFFGTQPRPVWRGPALLPVEPAIPAGVEDYSRARKYADERRILGLSVGEHIMALYRPGLEGAVDADSRRLADRVGRRVRIAGVLEAGRTTPTRSGGTINFLTLDDEHGLFEVTVMPGSGSRRAAHVPPAFNRYGPYLVVGTVEDQYGSVTVSARSVSLHKPTAMAATS